MILQSLFLLKFVQKKMYTTIDESFRTLIPRLNKSFGHFSTCFGFDFLQYLVFCHNFLSVGIEIGGESAAFHFSFLVRLVKGEFNKVLIMLRIRMCRLTTKCTEIDLHSGILENMVYNRGRKLFALIF